MGGLSVRALVEETREELGLEVLAGEEGLDRSFVSAAVVRPGLALAGYFEHLPSGRVLLFGGTELAYLSTLDEKTRKERLRALVTPDVPCIIVARDFVVPPDLLEVARETGTPLLASSRLFLKLASRLHMYLEDRFAPETYVHGALLDVAGVGILILGASGIGKSECALDLVSRGHRLVADDVVRIRLRGGSILMGSAAEVIRHYLEVHGLGVINVKDVFGVGAVRTRKRVSLVVRLEEWDSTREYDRLGLDERTVTILGVRVPEIVLPVRPGRNLATLVEVAGLNHRLKRMGEHPAVRLGERLSRQMARAERDEEEEDREE